MKHTMAFLLATMIAFSAMSVQASVSEANGRIATINNYSQETEQGKMNAIKWPVQYLPGTTDNYSSNEIIVAGLSAVDVWPLLSNATLWPTYYSNSANIGFYNGKESELSMGTRFHFTTFGFLVEAEVTEYEPPANGKPGRIAWHGWVDGTADTRLDVLHAWLIEDLPGGRVRILTQESQIGKPARELAKSRPNPMINGHQDWLDGLVGAALKRKQ